MQPVTVEQVITMLRQLPPRDRLRVVGQVLPGLERELPDGPRPRKSLLGLCADLGPAPSAEEIDQARQEAWGSFPREDI
ncbi:MAG: hypothetical protein GXP41_09705 [Chloroflexi bacterium]|nr:hypothetical protein [Chloroflexota bacterium]